MRTPPKTRSSERGFAVIAILAVLGIVAVSLMVTSLNSSALRNEQDRKTTYALAQAKQALIGRAAADANRPGSLPCPDTDNDGIVTIGVDVVGNACASYVGRLPWKTLGLPDLRDADGERLWYALSPNFRDATGVAINSSTAGTLNVTGSVTANNAAAVVFAPGAPLQTQPRDAAHATNIASYLDGTNAKGTGTYEMHAASGTFNDRLIAIVPTEVVSVVERRLAKELGDAIKGYYTANAVLPYAATASCTDTCLAQVGVLSGRIPGDPAPAPAYAGTSQFLAAGSGSWFDVNGWRSVVQYTVAAAYATGGGGALKSSGGADMTSAGGAVQGGPLATLAIGGTEYGATPYTSTVASTQ